MKKTLLCLFAVVLLVMLIATPAMAAEPEANAVLPITQKVILDGNGANSSDGVVQYTLTPAKSDAPMPTGTKNGVYRVSLKGNGTYKVPAITFTQMGSWDYTLTAKSAKASVTPEEISITIMVVDENGELTPMVVAELPNGEKCDLSFEATVKGTGASTDPSKPGTNPRTGDSSYILLYCAAALVLTVLLIVLFRRDKKEQTEE